MSKVHEDAQREREERFVNYWTTRPADELAHALVDSEDEVMRLRALLAELAEERGEIIDMAAVLRAENRELVAKVDAAFQLAADVCDDLARQARDEPGGGARIEESSAMRCRDAILTLLGEQAGK